MTPSTRDVECADPFNAIDFALNILDDDWDRYLFLKDWRAGTVKDWPQYPAYAHVLAARSRAGS